MGSSVKLSPDYEDYSDAEDGPLKPGDVGEVLIDDRSEKPYKVRANGNDWWYKAAALVATSEAPRQPSGAADPEGRVWHANHEHPLKLFTKPTGWTCDVCRKQPGTKRYRCTTGCDWDACESCMMSKGHKSDFRGSEKTQWCSLTNSRDGPLCGHGEGIVTHEHWSCCGRRQFEAGCFSGASSVSLCVCVCVCVCVCFLWSMIPSRVFVSRPSDMCVWSRPCTNPDPMLSQKSASASATG